jgi:hypothetical protein
MNHYAHTTFRFNNVGFVILSRFLVEILRGLIFGLKIKN